MNGEQEAYKLSLYGKDTTGELEDGKWRETPISRDTKRLIYTLASMDGRKDSVLVDVDRRTVQRWVAEAGEKLAKETGNEDWNKLTAHDCRISWATTTYYQLSGSKDVAQSVIMRWGGWSDAETFERNYLGREPDSLAIKLMDDAGLR